MKTSIFCTALFAFGSLLGVASADEGDPASSLPAQVELPGIVQPLDPPEVSPPVGVVEAIPAERTIDPPAASVGVPKAAPPAYREGKPPSLVPVPMGRNVARGKSAGGTGGGKAPARSGRGARAAF